MKTMRSTSFVSGCVIFMTCFTCEIIGEYFTSTSHLRTLLMNEKQLAFKLTDFITYEERRIQKLQKFYNKVTYLENITTSKDINTYVGHPIKAYLTLRRMVKDWPKLKTETISTTEKNFHSLIEQKKYMFPTDVDMEGARNALLRLQETFSLSSHEISEGISGDVPIAKLGAQDAFDIGKKAYLKSEHLLTASWMSEALRLLDMNRHTSVDAIPTRYEILDHLAWSEYVSNDMDSAYKHTLELLKIEPDNERFQSNIQVFQRMIKERNVSTNSSKLNNVTKKSLAGDEMKKRRKKYPRFYYTPDEDEGLRYLTERKRSHELCRGETDPIPKAYTNQLVCWFKRTHPLLILKPAKIERVYPKPEILLFRDAITTYEMRRVKELAHPLLKRATVHNPATGQLEFADYRTSKSAWLDESDDMLVDVMNKRIDAYTGLNMETAEKLQVANYGMGGHYETHFDFARTVPLRPPPWKNRTDYTRRAIPTEREALKENGNRIATVLFYMSNVERGGATVFTNIGQAVKPTKGDAVFWFNLHHDGSGDYNTRHAACPVLIGEKWVSNRWIHEHGQEFRRPCKLKVDDDS